VNAVTQAQPRRPDRMTEAGSQVDFSEAARLTGVRVRPSTTAAHQNAWALEWEDAPNTTLCPPARAASSVGGAFGHKLVRMRNLGTRALQSA
jgi:hypothetical protein